MSVDELIQIFPYLDLEKIRNAAEKNSDASEPTINITQDMQDAQEVHENENEDDCASVKAVGLDELLSKYGLSIKNDKSSWSVIGAKATTEAIYSKLGYEKMDFLFYADTHAWTKGHSHGVKRCDGAILKELGAFIFLYWDYGIDKDRLILRLSKVVNSQKLITPGDFKKMITNKQGQATLNLYSAGMEDKNRFPDITRKRKIMGIRR